MGFWGFGDSDKELKVFLKLFRVESGGDLVSAYGVNLGLHLKVFFFQSHIVPFVQLIKDLRWKQRLLSHILVDLRDWSFEHDVDILQLLQEYF